MDDTNRERLQAEVDNNERDVEVRYERWQQLMAAIAEGARRAEAMRRLERALELRAVG